MDAKIGAYGALPSAELPTTTTRQPPRRERLACLRPAHVAAGLVAIAACAALAERARKFLAQPPAPPVCDWRAPDYAIVGGGPAGSVVASRLAKDGQHCVLILEAGGPYRGNPDFGEAWDLGEIKETDRTKNPAPTDVPRMWSDVSRVDNLRWPITSAVVAKMVGGCGAMNAMIYLRGLPYDVARWNVSRWSWSGVSSAYARFERRLDTRGRVARRGGGPQRGWAGPLATRRAPLYEQDALAQAFLETCQAAGHTLVTDFNAQTSRGNVAGPYHFNIDERGRRASAYASLLEPIQNAPNVKVITRATARRLRKDHGRGVGVEYVVDGDDDAVVVRPRRGVALAAGALNTPRLLLASDLGGHRVGQNLHDHPVVPLKLRLSTEAFYRTPGPFAAFSENGAETLWASPGTSVGAFLRSSKCEENAPADLQLTLFAPGQEEPHVDEVLADKEKSREFFVKRDALVTVALLRPQARHSIELNVSDPYGPPLIRRGPQDPTWYQPPRCPESFCRTDTAWVEDSDAAVLLEGIDFVARLTETPPLNGAVDVVDKPPPTDDTARLAWVRARALTNSHWVGTAAMGDRKDDVVDGDLRLRDEPSVVVADASAIPAIPNGNVHTTVLVVAARAAEALLRIRR